MNHSRLGRFNYNEKVMIQNTNKHILKFILEEFHE